MTSEEVIQHANRFAALLQGTDDPTELRGLQAQACEFLKRFAGPDSSFYENAKEILLQNQDWVYRGKATVGVMSAFVQFVELGLHAEVTPERRAELDVVSDFLEQAALLLEAKAVHAAAPAMIIGATLEEFLRTWVEHEGLSLGSRKPSIDSYCQVLRDAKLITKQDVKDVTAWGGIRNLAAHGEWDQVASKEKVSTMLQGVNLFMRRYEKGKTA